MTFTEISSLWTPFNQRQSRKSLPLASSSISHKVRCYSLIWYPLQDAKGKMFELWRKNGQASDASGAFNEWKSTARFYCQSCWLIQSSLEDNSSGLKARSWIYSFRSSFGHQKGVNSERCKWREEANERGIDMETETLCITAEANEFLNKALWNIQKLVEIKGWPTLEKRYYGRERDKQVDMNSLSGSPIVLWYAHMLRCSFLRSQELGKSVLMRF